MIPRRSRSSMISTAAASRSEKWDRGAAAGTSPPIPLRRRRIHCRNERSRRNESGGLSMLRWRIAILVSAAIAISYLDRQTLPVAIGAIREDLPISNQVKAFLDSAFLVAYG